MRKSIPIIWLFIVTWLTSAPQPPLYSQIVHEKMEQSLKEKTSSDNSESIEGKSDDSISEYPKIDTELYADEKSIFSIYDFQGRVIFITPSIQYNLFENIDVTAALMIGSIIGNQKRASDFEYIDKRGLFYASLIWYF